jgi:hypothetical protein
MLDQQNVDDVDLRLVVANAHLKEALAAVHLVN